MTSLDVIVATFGAREWEERGSQLAIRLMAKAPSGVTVICVHLPAGTLAEARNRAASYAYSEWLCFIDADDDVNDAFFESMLNATQSAVGEFLLAPYVAYQDIFGYTEPRIPNMGRWPKLNECVIGTLVRRSLFMAVEGFREWQSLEDYDLWLRCVSAGASIVHIPGAIYLAQRGHRRNADQSPYEDIVKANASVFL